MAKKMSGSSVRRSALKEVFPQPAASPQSKLWGEEGVDIVVPMVFPDRGVWHSAYYDACKEAGRKFAIDERYRSWNLERYFFRGIDKFLPFVRKVHLILSDEDQIPFWINTDNVHIVLHKDIMPEELLPTFNSSTIEMWIHNIKGLSEKFIYCNDDMIATAPMTEEDFFKNGKPVTCCKEKVCDVSGVFLRTVRNSLDMAAKDHGVTFDENILLRDGHTFSPMLLSAIREVVDRHGEEMKESCTMFREEKNMCQYLYTYEMWLDGKCHEGGHKHKYFNLGSSYYEMEKMILSGEAGVACFNDSGVGSVTEMEGVLFRILQKILGDKCKYELI